MPTYFIYFVVFVTGLILGSFLNVVILRFRTGFSALDGRSICFSCGKTLVWSELIPLFSYIFLRGRCAKCKSKISLQYFIVELLTAIIFALVFMKEGLTWFLPFWLFVALIFIFITVYDFRHKIIPDSSVVLLSVVSIVYTLYLIITNERSWWSLLDGLYIALPFALLWIVSRGRWIGLGDAKLVLSFGWLLGVSFAYTAVVLGFWIGAVVSISLLLLQRIKGHHRNPLSEKNKQLTMKSEIPFAPFLILGFGIVYLFSINFFDYIF